MGSYGRGLLIHNLGILECKFSQARGGIWDMEGLTGEVNILQEAELMSLW